MLKDNDWLRSIARLYKGHQPIFLEYRVDMKPRWTEPRGNPYLADVIGASDAKYRENLEFLRDLTPVVRAIEAGETEIEDINWRNGYIPALDALTIMWAALGARRTFLEIGSGNSTRFARAALKHHSSSVRIVSIDPEPRVEIDRLCDEVIRGKLEDVDLALFDQLDDGDVMFVDSSHRSFMNSDVTATMLEILPRLKPGVLVGFHDICLPFDYPERWKKRAFNEQYLLGCYLLANPTYLDVQFANYWISRNEMHVNPLSDIWLMLGDDVRDRGGSAFWGIKT